MSFFSGRRHNEDETTVESNSARIGFDTVLSSSTVLEGTLKSEGNIRLDGKFTGKLDITGNVLVGETAEINADIEARNISIAGTVRGNVSGNKVQLLRTGRIRGDIQSNSLSTEEGAFIEGKVAMNIVKSVEPESVEESTGDVQEDDNATIEADGIVDDSTDEIEEIE